MKYVGVISAEISRYITISDKFWRGLVILYNDLLYLFDNQMYLCCNKNVEANFWFIYT